MTWLVNIEMKQMITFFLYLEICRASFLFGNEDSSLWTSQTFTKRPAEEESLSRNQFTAWATEYFRVQMRQLLKLLQLRSILLYLFMMFNHDSTAVCKSEGTEILVCMA